MCPAQLDFTGAGFNVWGGTGPAAAKMLYELTRRATHALAGAHRAARAEEIRQNVSLTLARAVARQLRLAIRVMDHAPNNAAEGDRPPAY